MSRLAARRRLVYRAAMRSRPAARLAPLLALLLAACAAIAPQASAPVAPAASAVPSAPPALEFNPPLHPNETPELRRLIEAAAAKYDVPADLVHRVVIRESHHRPKARNGPYYGLMQIHPSTARAMGFVGNNADLLDAATNLEFAVKYLRGAWIVAEGDRDAAVKWYASGYYYEAKRKGLLAKVGLARG